MIKATHAGELVIGKAKIICAVLEGGIRVLSQNGISKALGRETGGADFRKVKESEGGKLPLYLALDNLKPFISNELLEVVNSPILYKPTSGGRGATGIKAEFLPMVCDVWLQAREAGVLSKPQIEVAKRAEILMRGLAHIGIIALVDEATGYQEIRDRQALQKILDKYLLAQYAKWAKRFPDDFYQEMFRLKGWSWNGLKVNRPSIVAYYTKDTVYQRLAPGILKELETRNPVLESGRRKVKHHQFLTEDIGHPALAQHIHAVIGLMRAAATWDQFHRMLERAFPKLGETLPLALDD